ncbi:MAG: hypothetical protein J5856_04970 [Lachnospiraceae bacterium]|nr:hypothetical protein [Lachnospiraceae bacterium]
MITLTFIVFCAIAPFVFVFVLSRIIFHFVEKTLDFLIEKVFSLPENILDSIKAKFRKKGKLPEAVDVKD